jgi:hypothetical protein
MGGNRPEAAILALRRNRGILLGGDKTDVVQLQIQLLDGLLNQVAILVAQVLKLRRGHAHIQRAPHYVAVSSGFEPGLERLADYLLLQSCENLKPRVYSRRW